ncbi:MAG: hypothetical protein ACWGHO_00560 [Candidatus Moraniibacteriota bacterium]
MKKEKKIFFPRGKKIIASLILLAIVSFFGTHALMVHQEVEKIKADGGYYAVGEKINEFGLPEIVRKNLE